MADVTIPGLTLLTSIDRAADLFEVSDTSDLGNSKRTTVNNILDLASHPVGVDDSQTLTLKTLTAPTIASPVLSGTVTGTYTLGGTPTFPSAVVTLTGSQTLTNKTLTSPTINTATITNPTLTVDTVSEHTSANGVTVDGLNIKDGKLNTANSVVATNVTDAIITNAKLSTTAGEVGGAWLDWTPTWVNLTVGNGTLVAKYTKIGKTVVFRLAVIFGSTTSIAGVVSFTLPVTSVNYISTGATPVLGGARYLDFGTASFDGAPHWLTTTTAGLRTCLATGTYIQTTNITNLIPHTWATTDELYCQGTYEAP